MVEYINNTSVTYSFDDPLQRENLFNTVTIMSPLELPLFSILPQVGVDARRYEFGVRDIPRPETTTEAEALWSGTGSVAPEGAPASFQEMPESARLHNVAQINQRAVDVTRTARRVDIAGNPDKLRERLETSLLKLAMECELAAHVGKGRNTTSESPTGSDARMTHGLLSWIAYTGLCRTKHAGEDALINFNNAGGTPVNPLIVPDEFCSLFKDFAKGSGQSMSRTEFFDDVLAPAWRIGFPIQNSMFLSGSKLKQIITDWGITVSATAGKINELTIPAEYKKLINSIHSVDTNLGQFWLNIDRYLDPSTQSTAITYGNATQTHRDNFRNHASGSTAVSYPLNSIFVMIQPKYWHVALIDGLHHEDLAKVGDSFKSFGVAEWGIKPDNPIAGCGGGRAWAA